MIGLIALAFVVVFATFWIAISIWLSKRLVRPIKNQEWREPLGVLLFLLLLPLPIVDEIVGKLQFERLCQENSMIQIDRKKAMGRAVYLDVPPLTKMSWTLIPITLQPRRYFDAESGDFIASYAMLTAFGGVMVRIVGFPEGGGAITFNGSCGPKENPRELFKALGMTVIDRPTVAIRRGDK